MQAQLTQYPFMARQTSLLRKKAHPHD
jgi:hypothetical protein